MFLKISGDGVIAQLLPLVTAGLLPLVTAGPDNVKADTAVLWKRDDWKSKTIYDQSVAIKCKDRGSVLDMGVRTRRFIGGGGQFFCQIFPGDGQKHFSRVGWWNLILPTRN